MSEIEIDIKVAKRKWNTHRKHCGRRKVRPLTFDEYVSKLIEAGITPHQVGRTNGSYQLGRITDSGDYTIDSCRFITQVQNLIERTLNGGTERGASKNRGKTSADTEWLARRAENYRGRTAETHEHIARMADTRAKHFSFIHENGDIMQGKNLRKYCRENGLMSRRYGFNKLRLGKIKTYNGWRVLNEE